MAVTFDTSSLLSFYQAKTALAGMGSRSAAPTLGSNGKVQYAPTAPWSTKSTAPRADALVKSALLGRKLIDESAAKLDLDGASTDYKKLFALYQGLNALYGMTEKAGERGVSALELTRLTSAFTKGLAEVGSYADSLKLEQLRLTRGDAMTSAKTAVGVPKAVYGYTTDTLYTGQAADEVPAFQGAAAFEIQVTKYGVPKTVNIDLSEMGATPRTMSAVVGYINGKLQDQGVTTRFAVQRTKGEERVVDAGGKKVTLPAVGDAFALKINGDSTEKLTFTAVSKPAVYVTTYAGNPDPDKNVKTEDGVFENKLLKIDPSGATGPDTRIKTDTLDASILGVKTSITGPDGSIYMLADIDKAVDGQTIKGERDTALLKYDSAGNLLYARTLGAADQASGLNIALSADGKIAIAGSVVGDLQGATNGPINSNAKFGLSDSFVTLFDAKGDEVWTMRRGALQADEATGVAFGSDGSVYVTGRTKSALPGSTGIGGYDGYLTAYSTTDKGAPKTLFTQSFGTSEDDKPAGIVVDGAKVTVVSSENGHAVLRDFATTLNTTKVIKTTSGGVLTTTIETYENGVLTNSQSSAMNVTAPDSTSTTQYTSGGTLTAGASRDLGDLMGGAIAGLRLQDGKLWIAGQTRNAALSISNAANSHAGAMDAFAATVSADLGSTANDALAYYGGAGDNTVAGMAVAGGKVWLVGSAGADLPGLTSSGTKEGYVAALDLTTGTVSGAQRISGKDGYATATSVAVDMTGASVLDKFGLPKGAMSYEASQKVVSATSARAGDQFQIRTRAGGTAQTITIEANDTLESLASKISRKAGYQVKVQVQSAGDNRVLRISPMNDNSTVEILPGKGGKDALEALGLSQGIVRNTDFVDGKTVTTAPGGEIYGLGLKLDLEISSKQAIANAQSVLNTALGKIRTIYRDLEAAAKPQTAASQNAGGPVPAYLQAQLANYQAGLDRLGGGF